MARTAETDRLRAVKREKTSDADTARLRTVKRERLSKNSSGNGRGVRGEEEGEEERLSSVTSERLRTNSGGNGEERKVERLRTVKRQRLSRNGGDGDNDDGEDEDEEVGTTRDRPVDRRELRSRYTAVKNLINDEKDDLNNVDSDKFRTIIREVDNLHQLVQKPREQVADAEALLGISCTLMTSVKSHSNGGLTPKDFIAGLIEKFSNHNGHQAENAQVSIDWKVIGSAVSKVFRTSNGCCTMLGPMDTELKQRKYVTRTKRVQSTQSIQPEEMQSNGDEERTDTDKNMLTMFNILRKNKSVRFEKLILNRKSFAQTVENMFALSFLVKDGRAQINVDENNSHFISPKNAPAANLVLSKEVSYCHFILRLDFNDWKLMMDMVPDGEELMPHRDPSDCIPSSQEQPPVQPADSQGAYPTTPIRKHSRNRGILIQENTVVEDSPPADVYGAATTTPIRKHSRNRGILIQENTVVEESPPADVYGAATTIIRKGKGKLM